MYKELQEAPVTWFVTLTFKPQAREKLFSGDVDKHKAALFELTDYMKRLRHHVASGVEKARLRFVAVTEDHKDGTPHIHLLVHGQRPQLNARTFKKARWPHGFIDARIADADTAAYLTKYLTKENARLRASTRYGRQVQPGENTSQTEQAKSKRPLREDIDPQEPSAYTLLQRGLVANVFNGDIDASDGQAILSTILSLVPSQEAAEHCAPTIRDATCVPETGAAIAAPEAECASVPAIGTDTSRVSDPERDTKSGIEDTQPLSTIRARTAASGIPVKKASRTRRRNPRGSA